MSKKPATPDQPIELPGIKCRACGCSHLNTTNTRKGPGFIRRWKQCRYCGTNTITTEKTSAGSSRAIDGMT